MDLSRARKLKGVDRRPLTRSTMEKRRFAKAGIESVGADPEFTS